jgi:hypothetical protein
LDSLAPVEDISDEESGDIPFRDAPEDQANDKATDDPAEEDEDDDEEEEGVLVAHSCSMAEIIADKEQVHRREDRSA